MKGFTTQSADGHWLRTLSEARGAALDKRYPNSGCSFLSFLGLICFGRLKLWPLARLPILFPKPQSCPPVFVSFAETNRHCLLGITRLLSLSPLLIRKPSLVRALQHKIIAPSRHSVRFAPTRMRGQN